MVLLSHDQHPDNLDRAGRAFLARVPLVLTTPTGANRLHDADRSAAAPIQPEHGNVRDPEHGHGNGRDGERGNGRDGERGNGRGSERGTGRYRERGDGRDPERGDGRDGERRINRDGERGNVVGLAAWTTVTAGDATGEVGPKAVGDTTGVGGMGGGVTVTAVPAQHGPDGTEGLTGPVTGFVLRHPDEPTVYVSGDNASLDVVRAVAAKFSDIAVALLFGGAARTPLVGDANLTLDAAGLVAAARIIGEPEVHAIHIDGWGHFTEGHGEVRAAFEAAGLPVPLR